VNVGAHRSLLRNLVRLCSALAVGRGTAGERARGRTFTALALSIAALFALCAGAAQAAAPKLVTYGGFSTSPPDGVVDGVAVDQSSGDVYVARLIETNEEGGFSGFGHVDKFDGGGKELRPPSPFAGGFDSGAAVNPTNGNVYVLKAAPSEIEIYDPSSGAPVGSPFSVPPSNNIAGALTVVQIATDSAGNVYVPVVPENEVLEYSPTGTLLRTFTGGGRLSKPTGVAVDSSGDLWVADSGNDRIVELDSSDAPVEVNGKPVEINSEGVGSIALDGHGDVLAIVRNGVDSCGSLLPPCSHLVEYTSGGVQVADVGAGSFESEHHESFLGPVPMMVAVSESSGRVYVSDVSNKRIWIFGPPAAPVVRRELTAEVGTSEAKLGALIGAGGIQTTYSFEYDTREYAQGEGPHGHSTPFPVGSVGEGVTSHTVWAAASGLEPGTTYHYRVVATNELAPEGVAGPDQTFTTLSAKEARCEANEEFRGGFSARLPDCRAYELLTPPVKSSSQFDTGQAHEYGNAAKDGNALSLFTKEPQPGAPTAGQYYVATRGASGWALEDIIPLESYAGILCTAFTAVPAYSQEISSEVMVIGEQSSASPPFLGNAESCNADGIQVVSGEPVGYENLLVRENATGTYRLVNTPPPGVTPAAAHFRVASADLSHVVFSELAPLTKDATPGAENLYEWDEGAVRLVTVLPDGTPVAGSLAARPATRVLEQAISVEGSHVLFTSGGGLYDRIAGERTVQVDKTLPGAPGASGGGVFVGASADGSHVFFTDESRLTVDSTAASKEPDLYECILSASSTCELTDLTVAAGGEHAGVLAVSPLGSKDSSHVYFLAKAVLAANTREYTNAEGKAVVEGAQAGQQNLYLRSGAGTTFIATLGESESGLLTDTAVSPDGAWFAFDSVKSITGYDNARPNTVEGANEIYLYDAASNQIVCASCNPSGEAPVLGNTVPLTARHQLADGGRLFFETREALVPADTNGQGDVYEYENGARLISSGTSGRESVLIDASESGDDVFINTFQRLVPQDTQEGMTAIYDARVGGGFPAPASPPPCTTADACRAPVPLQPSIYGAPASQTFSGLGNLTPASEAKPKPKRKAKAKKIKKKACTHNKHKRARCASHARRAGAKAKSHRGGK
jgi:NHL repeat